MNNSVKYNDKLNVIGEKLKYYRELNKLSQSQVSNRLQLIGRDIPKNSLQRLENGKRILRDYELAGFSKIFNVSIDEMLKEFINELE